jgi:membrane protein DedA with SNARE-associated domain/rhodanese-related sulfurtransferase
VVTQLLRDNGLALVFLNVLLQQLGLPLPVVPTLLLAGSLAAAPLDLGILLVLSVLASLMADWLWFRAGRRFGYRVLSTLCKLSINPASCVTATEARFARWGLASLLLAKFIPGFSAVAPPIAGALRMKQSSFLLTAALGGALWAGLALGTGWLLKDQVMSVIAVLESHALLTVLVVLAALALWLAWKLGQRYRFIQRGKIPHATPAELLALLDARQPVKVIDLRSPGLAAESGLLPGATLTDRDHLLEAVADWPLHEPIITVCACPQDAGAVDAARRLQQAGYVSVKPLKGGHEAWVSASAGRK